MPRNRAATKKIIMLIEDDSDIRNGIAAVLTLGGFRVMSAANGQDALAQLAKGPKPDLILLDISMPIKDGVQFRKEQEMDASLASIPVVIMTAHEYAESKRFEVGAKDVLKKPFEIDAMLEIIRRHCA